jgi:hypothetical protein
VAWFTNCSSPGLPPLHFPPKMCWICLYIGGHLKLFWQMKTASKILIVGVHIPLVGKNFGKSSTNGSGIFVWNSDSIFRLLPWGPRNLLLPLSADRCRSESWCQSMSLRQEAQVYGPPQWARRSFTGGFPGSAFTLQPDGSLLCPANHSLFAQARRPERDGSLRVLYAARIGDCRQCELRAHCQESLSTNKPRRVSAVFWPVTVRVVAATIPSLPDPPPKMHESVPCHPVLWGDWPRCQIRRNWLKVVRSETVVVAMGVVPTEVLIVRTDEHVITRAERAHWRLSWEQRLARNARHPTAPSLTITIHGLPASFAHPYAFDLLGAA